MPLPSHKWEAIKELLRDPFGPYRDEDVLSAECQSKPGKTLVLNSFQLAYNDEIIGLDESEQPLGTGEIDSRQYRFRGILSIQRTDWLSQLGLKRVEAELNLRARTRGMREGERVPSLVTLEELYKGYLGHTTPPGDDNELELKLKIQGFKNFSAVYMLSKLVPNGLLWHSKNLNRSYEVATMHISTFRRSENFFWRYRLLALMTKIVEERRTTPFEKRTPEWFVSQYIQRFAHPPSDKHERLIYDSSDSDIISGEEGQTQLPRHPRRIHRMDILGLFAAHSEWFVTDNEVKRQKLFPFKPWNEFRKKVRKARYQSIRNNVIWGWPIGCEYQPDLESGPDSGGEQEEEDDDDDDDDTQNMVERNPVTGKTNEFVRRKINKGKAKRSSVRVRHIVSSSEESSDESELDPARVHAYVPGFSDESSAADSDSSDESEDAHLGEFEELIPRQLSQVPELPGPDNRWWCPVPDCRHMIDLQHLTRDSVGGLPGEVVYYFMKKKRNIREDETAQKYFHEMVSKHYEDHFANLGLNFVQTTRGRLGIDWTRRSGSHRRGQQDAVVVKEEVI
ncbi:uncharacterized protein EDB91DRAFT_1244577 [Suillus paluster]|uniref:uncharacterized protein n=1 Tax=Suillus paluster TaxID=48578 RepID=UPI001B878E2D|nr:uncharacterized protein EDB91DRAFT_1244577 [Suillus paluster]KAG1749979.1 hypothetical protein EDB91DRAFT_1244577 [Suillus paluster]